MKGVSFAGDRTIAFISIDDPTPAPGEVVLEMKASGVCGSDLKFYRASKSGGLAALGLKAATGPVIGGHEPCGVIAEVGSGVSPRSWKIGDRVMVHHYSGCASCPHCRTGWTQMCVDGADVYGANAHGGHARYMKVPASTLVHLPDELTFSAGAAISCGTGTAFGALARIGLTARDTIAIVGQGPVGLSATQFAAAMGASVIAIDINAERLVEATRFGARHVINSAEVDPVEAIRELTKGGGVGRAMDTSGTAIGRSVAIRAAAPWGVVAMVGEGGDVTIDVSPQMIRKQLTIVGSWTFSTTGQEDCARFVAGHGIKVDELFSHRWKLDQAVEAYRLFDEGGSSKAVFDI